jgi:hypothetical protein
MEQYCFAESQVSCAPQVKGVPLPTLAGSVAVLQLKAAIKINNSTLAVTHAQIVASAIRRNTAVARLLSR